MKNFTLTNTILIMIMIILIVTQFTYNHNFIIVFPLHFLSIEINREPIFLSFLKFLSHVTPVKPAIKCQTLFMAGSQ